VFAVIVEVETIASEFELFMTIIHTRDSSPYWIEQ
jgi:hypothetical protein